MATKTFTVDSLFTGLMVYYTCRRDADGYALKNADGTFAAAPITMSGYCLSMPESGTVPGRYEATENRVPFNDGTYTVIAYNQIGASPDPLSDGALGYGVVTILNDAEVTSAAQNATAVLAAATLAPIAADMQKTNGTALQGDGTTSDKFRSSLVA